MLMLGLGRPDCSFRTCVSLDNVANKAFPTPTSKEMLNTSTATPRTTTPTTSLLSTSNPNKENHKMSNCKPISTTPVSFNSISDDARCQSSSDVEPVCDEYNHCNDNDDSTYKDCESESTMSNHDVAMETDAARKDVMDPKLVHRNLRQSINRWVACFIHLCSLWLDLTHSLRSQRLSFLTSLITMYWLMREVHIFAYICNKNS